MNQPTSRSEPELLPCPFCGGEPDTYFVTGMSFHQVCKCKQCHAGFEVRADAELGRRDLAALAKAVGMWNKRAAASEKQSQQVLENREARDGSSALPAVSTPVAPASAERRQEPQETCKHTRQGWTADARYGSCLDCGKELGEPRVISTSSDDRIKELRTLNSALAAEIAELKDAPRSSDLAPHHPTAAVRRFYFDWHDSSPPSNRSAEVAFIAGYRKANEIEYAARSATSPTNDGAAIEKCEKYLHDQRCGSICGLRKLARSDRADA